MVWRATISRLTHFYRSESGTAVVEFAIVFPLMILVFAMIVEFGRMYWGFQSVVAGVRDASRYVARMAPVEVCIAHPSGGNLMTYISEIDATDLKTMVEDDFINSNSVLPGQYTVTSVSASYSCEDKPSGETWEYRTPQIPLATVTANVTVQFPLGFLFSIFGSGYSTVTTTVSDDARIFGT